MRLSVAIALLSASAACDTSNFIEKPDFDLNRMIDQPRADAFEASDVFASGGVMQNPPEGVVARDAIVDDDALRTGYAGLRYLEHIAIPVDAAVLTRGRDRFDVFCAPCHGLSGEGNGPVSRKLPSIPARSFHLARVRSYPPGRIFRVISEGYGMMGSYATQLSVRDRWAVVTYVRALQASQAYALEQLAPEERRRVEEAQ